MKIQKKFALLLIVIISIVLKSTISYCTDMSENMLSTQQESFGINSFVEKSKQYSGEFFDDMDISGILNSAIKGEI